MERMTRLLLIFTILFVAFAFEVKVEGGRSLKNKDDDGDKEEVAHPQNFFAGIGTFPSPGMAAGFGFGPSGFCSFPGLGCVRLQPTNPSGSVGAGGGLPLP